MLHVSPASVRGGSRHLLFYAPAKQAYIDLQPCYANPQVGLASGEIDVVVLDRDRFFDEKLFRSRLPTNVTVKSLTAYEVSFDEENCEYCVCYLPASNKLIATSRTINPKSIESENVFAPRQPAQENMLQPK